MKIVQHEQQPGASRDPSQDAQHCFEQPVALGLGLALGRGRKVGNPAAELGQQPLKLGAVLAHDRLQLVERRARDVVAQGLEEWLIGGQGLLRGTAGEHDGAAMMQAAGELGRQSALADTGVPAQKRDGQGVLPLIFEEALDLGQLPPATDKLGAAVGP